MRTNEILHALSRLVYGIKVYVSPNWATVATRYQPILRSGGKTVFEAAIVVGKQLIVHPDCPSTVRTALEDYDRHSQHTQV